MLIEKENTNVVTFKQAIEQNQTTDDYYQTQYKILQSRALARRTLEAAKLWDSPQLNPTPDRWSVVPEGVLGAGQRHGVGLVQAPRTDAASARRLPPMKRRKQSAIIDRFLARLAVRPIRNSRLVDVKYNSPDPAFAAARRQRAWPARFIEQNLEFKFLSSKEAHATGWASGWRSSASRSTPASRRCSATASRTTRSRSTTGRTSSCRSWPT